MRITPRSTTAGTMESDGQSRASLYAVMRKARARSEWGDAWCGVRVALLLTRRVGDLGISHRADRHLHQAKRLARRVVHDGLVGVLACRSVPPTPHDAAAGMAQWSAAQWGKVTESSTHHELHKEVGKRTVGPSLPWSGTRHQHGKYFLNTLGTAAVGA